MPGRTCSSSLLPFQSLFKKAAAQVTRGGNVETWTGPLSGGRHIVALLNRSPSAEEMPLSFHDDLGLPAASRWRVRDAWTDSELALGAEERSSRVGKRNLVRDVPAHGVEVMLLSPEHAL